jgi:hypothetical protein
MKKILKVSSAIIAAIVLALLAISAPKAQNAIPLVVAPARQSLAADPGKIVSFAVRFYNTGTAPIPGTFKTADFIVTDNQGTPAFLDNSTPLSNRFAAAQWVTLNTGKGTIPSTGMVTINGTIRIPSNARPGGRYFAVYFEPDASAPVPTGVGHEEAAVTTMRLAGLVYLRVNGPISEAASVIRFAAPLFSEFGPVPITTEIKNSGDYHITPTGQITVKDLFGHVVSQTDLTQSNVFPDASRVTTTQVGEKWMVGRFSATLDATYGDAALPLTASLAFWVFPWKLAVIIILAIIITALIIFIIFQKFIKKEKKLEAQLVEEKEELEKLKESLEDKISEAIPGSKK